MGIIAWIVLGMVSGVFAHLPGLPRPHPGRRLAAAVRGCRPARLLRRANGSEINPVIAAPGGAFAAGARVRVSPAPAADPFLRQLR